MAPAGLEVEGLAVGRGGRAVLAGLSFALLPGDALILRGPNGSGKTSLLRVLAGLAPPLAGRVRGAEEAAFAGHADGVKAMLTVRENLAFWARLHRVPLRDEVLARFALTDLAGRPAGTLSAGQRRRLGLARLAVTGRRVLLLDEPTVSLDAASVERFADWLRETHLGQGGIAVIATHLPFGLAAPELDLAAFRARPGAVPAADEAFL